MKKTLILMTALFMAVSFAVAQITPIDEKTVEVRSTGRGMNTEEAKTDALVNAVDSVVLDMLTMTEEQMKYQTSKEAVLANALNYQVGGAKINGKITAKRTPPALKSSSDISSMDQVSPEISSVISEGFPRTS